MENLFEARLKGYGKHYWAILKYLKQIETAAKAIVNGGDYDNLPALGTSCQLDRDDDAVAMTMNVFWNLGNSYNSYYEYAEGYFKKAPRSDHSETLCRVLEIRDAFRALAEESLCTEMDVLVRLWFDDITERSAKRFGATLEESDEKGERRIYREISNFKHLQHVAHYTIDMFTKHFGYLEEAEA